MYGGVSLAVYMNGIAQELLRMVRATAPAGWGSCLRPISVPCGRSRADQHRTAVPEDSRQSPGALRRRHHFRNLCGRHQRCLLAKALAHNRPLDQLRRLWVQEGDVGRLLNDKGALSGNLPPELADDPPASLLSGQRFYRQLLEALEEMDKGPAMSGLEGCKRAPYVDEIDLSRSLMRRDFWPYTPRTPFSRRLTGGARVGSSAGGKLGPCGRGPSRL